MVEMLAGWLATLGISEFIKSRCEDHLGEAVENGAFAILKRFASKRQDGTLPQNHDLEHASRQALREAIRASSLGIAAHLDPKPPLFEAIRQHLKNGTLTNQPLIDLRYSPSREWFNKLQARCDEGERFDRLVNASIRANSDVNTLLKHRVDADAQRTLHEHFAAWINHEMQDVPGRPDFLDDFLQHGWPIEINGKQRITLYEAWCMFFREKLKHTPEVFRILVANTVVETANDVKELRALALQQPSLDDFHQWMGLRVGALQDWLDGRFRRLDEGQSKIQGTQEEHTEKLDELLKRTPATPTPSPGKPRNLAFASIGPLFKGRDDKINELYDKLQGKCAVVVHGLGGVGKTRFTIEYAIRYENEYSALLSVGASSPGLLRSNLAGLCTVLGLPEREAKEQDIQVSATLRWLNANPGWLLLLDNVDTKEAAAAVESELPNLIGGHVIITSRRTQWSKAVDTLPLEELPPAAAVEFLLEATDGKRVTAATDKMDAKDLAHDVGYLALALEQATAYIGIKRVSLATYRQRWQAREVKVRDWYDKQLMQYDKSVAVAWNMTFEELSPAARTLLRLLCWLAPDPIPRALLETEKANEVLNERAKDIGDANVADMEDAIAELASFSLLKWDADFKAVSIHRLVQEVTQDQTSKELQHDYIRGILVTVNDYIPANPPPHDVDSWPLWEPMRNHVATIIQVADKSKIADPTTRLMNDLGLLLNSKSIFPEAERLHRRALSIDEASYGAEHPDVARDLNNLATLLQATNRLAEAEPLMRRALSIDEASYGTEHPRVATHLNNLAQLLHATNRLAEAKPLMRRALSIDEASYGAAHPSVARDLNNLGQLLIATNRLAEAEPLMRRALSIDEASYGAAHPSVARDLNNLALLLQDTNRLAEAEPLMRRALSIDEASYGAEHPEVARDLNNLGLLLRATNRLSEAEPLMRRALSIHEASYGAEHPDVATQLNNLAQLLQATNRLAEAEPLMRRAAEISLSFFVATGHHHPNEALIIASYRNLLEAMDYTPEQIDARFADIAASFGLTFKNNT